MPLRVLLNSDQTPLLLFHINGDFGYCYDAYGAITKVALTAITMRIVLPKNTSFANHLLKEGKYTSSPLTPEPF